MLLGQHHSKKKHHYFQIVQFQTIVPTVWVKKPAGRATLVLGFKFINIKAGMDLGFVMGRVKYLFIQKHYRESNDIGLWASSIRDFFSRRKCCKSREYWRIQKLCNKVTLVVQDLLLAQKWELVNQEYSDSHRKLKK